MVKKKKKNPPTNAEDISLIPGLERCPGEDGQVMVESSDKNGPLEKGMANHFSSLALRISSVLVTAIN